MDQLPPLLDQKLVDGSYANGPFYLQIGNTGMSIDFSNVRGDPANAGGQDHSPVYLIAFEDLNKQPFPGTCISMIEAVNPTITHVEAVEVLRGISESKRLAHSTDPRRLATIKAVTFGLWTDPVECEVAPAKG